MDVKFITVSLGFCSFKVEFMDINVYALLKLYLCIFYMDICIDKLYMLWRIDGS